MNQELPHTIGRDVDYAETIDGFAGTSGDNRKHELKCVAVTALRIRGEIPFANHVFHQKTTNPWTE